MKGATILYLISSAAAAKVNPIEKTIQLLGDLQAKVVKDGENAQKLFEEFGDYCKDQAKELEFAIKTGKGESERQSATIVSSDSKVQAETAKIEELSAASSTNEADLTAAQEIRAQEKKDFAAADADLAETIDMLRRAAMIIEREMKKGPSFVQAGSMDRITSALQTLLDASSVNSLDKAKVQALLQSQSDDMQPTGAPDPAAYNSQSGGILQTLEDMLDKAADQRAEAQKAEMNANFNFELLQQKLQDEIAQQNKEMKAAKKGKAEAEETKAAAEGALAASDKAVAEDTKERHDLQQTCMQKATEFEAEQKERADELQSLATAKQILEEKTGGATARTYSFLQVKARTHFQMKSDGAKERAMALVQKLATDGSTELAQLAARLSSTVRQAALEGADPFAKIKGMISEMIEKLVADAQAEASHKAFCDKEMGETKAKREDKQDEVDALQTKIDKATAKIAKLKEEVATLQSELAEIARVQSEADATRRKEKEAWASAKADFESGVEGVGMALQILRDYYAAEDAGEGESLVQSMKHEKASGSATGIIGMLEVVEADFSKMLADGTVGEEQSQKAYEKLSQENEVATATKRSEVKYKEKDGKETASRLAGDESDRGVSQSELDAIVEYWEKLQPMCVAKPEPYAERKKRREAEIAGLKQALEILESESAGAFLQVRRA